MLLRRIALISPLVLLTTVLPLALPAGATAAPDAAVPVVVRFDVEVPEREQASTLTAAGLTLVDRLPGSDFALAVPEAGTMRAAAVVSDGIVSVEPVVTYRASGVPNDPAYPAQWHLPALDAASAWDVTTGEGTVVAVIDTGVAYETTGAFVQAPDLAGTRFVPGWDFVGGDAHPNDENGHGTHVTGSIAQTTGNGVGGAGVAPDASIMPLRVLDGTGAGTDFNVAQALRFAADHGAAVANLSLGGPTQSTVVRDAVTYATNKGVVIVASAGNDGLGTVSYPAANERVIAVGAVRHDRTRPSYGSYGAALDIVAPGGDLSVDQDGDGYPDGILQQTFRNGVANFCLCFMQGTSMAAPQVSAVAALIASRGVTDRQVIEDILLDTAVDLGPTGRDDQFGHGLVQAAAATQAQLPVEAPVDGAITPTEPEPTPTEPTPTEPAPTEPAPTEPTPEPAPVTNTGEPRSIELACPSGSTPASAFEDLGDSVHVPGITCAAWWGVASGRTASTFDPGGSVTRGQLASFVARTLETAGLQLPADALDAFGDDAGSVHHARINQLAALGVVQGRGDGTFAPDAVVTRAEMATFLVRAHDALSATDLAAGPDRFADDGDSVHAGNIDKVAAAGLAGGTSSSTFAPTAPVQRGQMATFLSRTLDLFVAEGTTPAR